MEIINELRGVRSKIDGLYNLADSLKPITKSSQSKTNSTEITMGCCSLRIAKAWLGECLEVLGEESKYKKKDGKRKSIKDISPIEDASQPQTMDEIIDWNCKNHIEKVDYIREEIGNLFTIIPDYGEWVSDYTYSNICSKCASLTKEEYSLFEEEALQNIPDWSAEMEAIIKHLIEARFWFGYELERIREEEKNKQC